MSKSEVANFREQIALEEQAMRLGFSGPAIVASHKAITARMERGAARILKLFETGRPQEVLTVFKNVFKCIHFKTGVLK